jgi:hypothetical protein
MGVRHGLRTTRTKLWREGDKVFAIAGVIALGLVLKDWYQKGADPATYPSWQMDDSNSEGACLIVLHAGKVSAFYEGPIPVEVECPFTAWGSGRDFAIAAMACGKTADEAVEIASLFDVNTGNGVDVYDPTVPVTGQLFPARD